KKSENFADYLQKEKKMFDQNRPKRQKILALVIALILGFLGIGSALFTISNISDFFLGIYINPLQNIPSEISAGLLIAVGIAAFLGISFSIIAILYKSFFSQSNWSNYHEQMLSLFRRLDNVDLLNEFIAYNEDNGKKRFQLTKVSIDFNIEWIYPFIFSEFPPLLFEFLLLSFLLPFLVTSSISLFFALMQFDLLTVVLNSFLLVLIFFGFSQSGLAIYRSWKKYDLILSKMISNQQEVIHLLILKKSDETTIIRHQNNLTRLVLMHSYPIPQIVRISALIPLVGSLVGYLIAITAIM
ncbi:MAG: hypothetical protein ACFFDI_31955, partial [Promethearchaeota archaeon]